MRKPKRHNFNKLICFFAVCLIIFGITVNVNAASIKLNRSSLSISLGYTYQLKAAVSGTNKKVTWKSGNSNVATISKNGVITPKHAGRVKITANIENVKASCIVNVYRPGLLLSDFYSTGKIDEITYGSPYRDQYTFLLSGSIYSRVVYDIQAAEQYSTSVYDVVRTSRNIKLNALKSDVLRAYGKTPSLAFNKNTDKMYLIDKYSFGSDYYNGTKVLNACKSILVYTYPKNKNMSIRFYLIQITA